MCNIVLPTAIKDRNAKQDSSHVRPPCTIQLVTKEQKHRDKEASGSWTSPQHSANVRVCYYVRLTSEMRRKCEGGFDKSQTEDVLA